MIPTYGPADFAIGLGIPGTPVYVSITDWISLRPIKSAQRFTGSKGILGEPLLRMSTDSSVTFELVILQSSVVVLKLHNTFLAQLVGFVGVPFSILDNGSDSNVNQGRQKTIYPVGVIVDETSKDLELAGKSWIYRIWSPSGATIFS